MDSRSEYSILRPLVTSGSRAMWNACCRSIALGMILALFSGPASAQTTLERVKREGVIRVGFPNQIPYAYANGLYPGDHGSDLGTELSDRLPTNPERLHAVGRGAGDGPARLPAPGQPPAPDPRLL